MSEILNNNADNTINEWNILTEKEDVNNDGQNIPDTEFMQRVIETDSLDKTDYEEENKVLPAVVNDDESFTKTELDQRATWEAEQINLFEQEATGKDYNNFAVKDFGKLLDQLNSDENQSDESQARITAELAIVSSLMQTANELNPVKPEDLFNNIRKACLDAATESKEKGHNDQAEAFGLQAAVTDNIENRCHLYMNTLYNTAANQAEEAERQTSTDAVGTIIESLPGDKIA